MKKVKRGKLLNARRDKKIINDFEIFAKSVERLEELRAELENLDTSGFAAEANSIRSKLKNVSYIPQIEKEMRELKEKIRGKHKNKIEKPAEYAKIHREINALEKEIQKRRNASCKKQLSEKEVRYIKDIPKIENQINYLKEVLKKYAEEEQRKKELLRKIDPGVDFMFNNKLNLTLNEIKAELSNRIKARETQIKQQLQENLETRKKDFELRYKELEEKFSNRYKEKVKNTLEKEVKDRFNEALLNRIRSLKRRLEKQVFEELKEKESELKDKEARKLKELEEERRRIKKKLSLEAEKELKKELDRLKSLLSNRENKELSEKKESMTEAARRERERIREDARRRMGLEKRKIENEKAMLKASTMRRVEELRKAFKERESRMLQELEKKHNELKSEIAAEKELEIKAKEKILRAELSHEKIENMKEDLYKEFEAKKNKLGREYMNKLNSEKERLRKHADEEILAYRNRLSNQLHEHLTSKIRKIHQEHNRKLKWEEEKIQELKRRIEEEKGLFSKIRNRLNYKLKRIRNNEKVYKKELFARLEKQKKEDVKNAVARHSVFIKKQLERDFHNRLESEIKLKQAEFEKQKAHLALTIQKKTRMIFS